MQLRAFREVTDQTLIAANGLQTEKVPDLRDTAAALAAQRAKGEQRVIQAGRDYAAGSTTMIPINPTWDNLLLDHLEKGELAEFDSWTVEWMAAEGGGSAHEVRTWIAAFASLAASGPYEMTSRFYEAIPAWIAGFAVATARSR